MPTKIIYAAISILAFISNTAQPGKPAIIISDETRSFASPQIGDLHDVTGHHRYYGSSASWVA